MKLLADSSVYCLANNFV